MAKASVSTKEEVLEAISQMSVMDLVELISEMEEKFGVTAAAPVAVAAAPAAGDSEDSASGDEQTEFEVILQGACSGCPSSTFTLKNGIENMLKQMLNDEQIYVEAINQ